LRYNQKMIIFKPHQAVDVIKNYVPKSPLIIEAGAFIGYETERLAKQWPNGTIHTFEPVPELFERLQKNTAHFNNIHYYHKALSNKSGSADLYICHKPEKADRISQGNSLHKPKERLKHSPLIFDRTLCVATTSIDDWAAQNSIDHIDLLWLDTQGHEKAIIQGATTLLPTVKIILTEVSFIQAYEDQLLFDDFTQWLQTKGFQLIGKDFQTTAGWFFGNALYGRRF
jgi:FkbM family methyltransferase